MGKYLRNPGFKISGVDRRVGRIWTGQANHLGVTIEADIIKQKLPENNGGYNALNSKENPYGKTNNKKVYTDLTSDHPIDLVRYQVANCYMGRASLINSGGASSGRRPKGSRTAVINKRGGCGRPDLGSQGLPATDGRGRGAAQRDPGCVPGQGDHAGVAIGWCTVTK